LKLGEVVLKGVSAPDWSVIYIVRDGRKVLYIGKSNNVELRLAQHFGYADPPAAAPSQKQRKPLSQNVGTGKSSLSCYRKTF
jgi:hypothetical protein